MNEVLTFPFEKVIKESPTSLTSICVPLVTSDRDLAMIIKKRLSNYFSEVFYVSWNKEDNSTYITYDQLEDFTNKYMGCLFITNNINDFGPYLEKLVNNNPNNNYFLTFNDVFIERSVIETIINDIDLRPYWPTFADLDIKYIYETRENYLTPSHSKLYTDAVANFNNGQEKDDSKIKGILNVYLDNKFKSLTELNLDESLLRSPKFKNIVIDLLLNNKQRHYIYMVDGMEGIDSFKILYDKVKNNNKDIPYLVIIKQSDSDVEKSEKIRTLNETNLPIVLLSDIAFKDDNMPMNINNIKIVNGGDKIIIQTVFSLSNAKFYTGIYPRKIYITNYISKNTNEVKTLDETNYKYFKINFIKMQQTFMECKKNAKLLIEDNKIMVRY